MAESRDILVIEDDEDICELIEFNLTREGFTVKTAINGKLGLTAIEAFHPRLIVLDIMMPELDGLSVLRHLRSMGNKFQKTPVIMLSAKGEESDVVVGLELGADDYVSKPFSPKELVARVRAVLRRTEIVSQNVEGKSNPDKISIGPVTIFKEKHEVLINGSLCPFTLSEYNILLTLLSAPGRVFTRDQLLEKITDGSTHVIDRNIDVHIRSIRKKLEQDPEFIQTVRGVGYKCRD